MPQACSLMRHDLTHKFVLIPCCCYTARNVSEHTIRMQIYALFLSLCPTSIALLLCVMIRPLTGGTCCCRTVSPQQLCLLLGQLKHLCRNLQYRNLQSRSGFHSHSFCAKAACCALAWHPCQSLQMETGQEVKVELHASHEPFVSCVSSCAAARVFVLLLTLTYIGYQH